MLIKKACIVYICMYSLYTNNYDDCSYLSMLTCKSDTYYTFDKITNNLTLNINIAVCIIVMNGFFYITYLLIIITCKFITIYLLIYKYTCRRSRVKLYHIFIKNHSINFRDRVSYVFTQIGSIIKLVNK